MSRTAWKAVWITGILAVVGAAGYGGWRIVKTLEDGAEKLAAPAKAVKPPPDINSFNLSQTVQKPPAQGGTSPLWQTPQSASSGEDVKIRAGEFNFAEGAQVRLLLQNQGGFPVTAASVRLALYLDDADDPSAEVLDLALPLGGVLENGEEREITLPLPRGDDWQAAQLLTAAKRRLLVQILSVADGSNENTEYPQTGAGVLLKQTGGMPQAVMEREEYFVPPADKDETDDEAAASE